MILKEKRLTVMLWLVTVALVWGYVANHLLACVIPEYGRWLERPLFSYIAPIGVDFRLGIYQPAQLLASGASPYDMKNWYPPFMALFGLPFTLLGEDAAYQLQVVLLTVVNGACLLLGLRVARRVFADAAARARLEGILHPRIRALWRTQVEAWRACRWKCADRRKRHTPQRRRVLPPRSVQNNHRLRLHLPRTVARPSRMLPRDCQVARNRSLGPTKSFLPVLSELFR